MPTYKKIKVAIYVDDVELPEFGTEEDIESRTMSCWIPSQLGKNFDLRMENESQKLAADVYIDGVRIYGATVKENGLRSLAYYPESDQTWRMLRFSKADLVDDGNLLRNSEECRGEIRVICYRFRELRKRNRQKCWDFPESNKVHESVKKGITDCIGLGDTTLEGLPLPRNRTVQVEDEIATFVFQYRCLDFLQACGIVPIKQWSPESPLAVAQAPGRKLGIKEENPEREIKREESLPNFMPDLGVKVEEDRVDEIDAKIEELLDKVEELRALKRKRSSTICLYQPRKIKVQHKRSILPVEIIDLTTENS